MGNFHTKKILPEFIGPPRLVGHFNLRPGSEDQAYVEAYDVLSRPALYDGDYGPGDDLVTIDAAEKNQAFFVKTVFTNEAWARAEQSDTDLKVEPIPHHSEFLGPFKDKAKLLNMLDAFGADIPDGFEF